MKNILLPTDFSDNAWSAAVYALKLFAKEECTFYFLHSSKMKASTMSNFSNRLLRAIAVNDAKDLNDLEEMAEQVSTNASHDFKTILSPEDLESSIEVAVNRHKIGLVVIGTKGITKTHEFLFGSNTVTIIKNMKLCPILVVPEEFDFESPEHIAFPTDFKRFYGEELEPVKQLAELYQSKIRILHINKEKQLSDTQNYNMSMLKMYLEEHSHSFHWMPDYAKIETAINDFIDELNISILVMISYKHSFIEDIVKEAVVKNICTHPKVPFFIIPCID